MRKRLLIVCIVILASVGLLTAGTRSYQFDVLDFTAYVPEDFGVVFPEDVLMLDGFVFENIIELEDLEGFESWQGRSLISKDEISLGSMQENGNSFSFRMLYYGNKEDDYDAYLVMDIGSGLKLERRGISYHIPVIVSMEPSDDRPDDVLCHSLGTNEAYIHIPASGPRRGIPVVDVELMWDGDADLLAGSYSAQLRIELRMS